MIPANCILVACPHCRNEKELFSAASGNTFGAQLWSDAKFEAPMLPECSPIQKCNSCGHYYLLSEAKYKKGNDISFETGWLSFEEAVEAYKELNGTNNGHLELLTTIVIWAYNDLLRCGKSPVREQYEIFKVIVSNYLKDPIVLVNELLRGELYREIEEYEECITFSNKYKSKNAFEDAVKMQIIRKAEEHIKDVFVIKQ